MDVVRAKLDWFKTVILPHQCALRARLRRILPHTADLDDLVSEVLTRAYAHQDWARITQGRAYLYTIARNLVIDITRRDKIVSFETVAELDLLQSAHSFDAQLCARDELRRMQLILEQLPAQCRRVFILRRVHEKSLVEIAAEMNLSVSTVEKHFGKAIRLFMRALAEYEDAGIELERAQHSEDRGDRGAGRTLPRPAHP